MNVLLPKKIIYSSHDKTLNINTSLNRDSNFVCHGEKLIIFARLNPT